ncbi:hypothetical protein QM716_11960 [Rhodococcus sp. IEGM 1409]|uniref:hypothetical protein n=1 Tax=Rhodococcus sp. IEGM 1409 TaxID=3047082 RepID=UPI0024B69F9D|nr:hypothetical protein [Rhodococcus sp. IEGM 1409]MDI9900567.1 hypothetical protein [Rhodococcus sp. IEGM 1409]
MTERELIDNRDAMSLAERVEARRDLDAQSGVVYDVPSAHQFGQLARVMAYGLQFVA